QWLHRLDLRAELPQVTQPVLLIWGDRDRVMPLTHAEILQSGLPSSGLAILEGAGHQPTYTHPDALAAVVRRFLTPPTPCPGAQVCASSGHGDCPGPGSPAAHQGCPVHDQACQGAHQAKNT